MIRRFCNSCEKELTSEVRYRMAVGITKVSNGMEEEVFNGDFDFCPDCMAKMAILGEASSDDKENMEGKGFEEVKPEDC